jgi:CheY-like chemotaxis protein/HPt (histidine-containing phosphotransfer) domain-containing protein
MPIVVLSNTYLASLVQEARLAGATQCLSKATCTATQLIQVAHDLLAPKTEPVPNLVPEFSEAGTAAGDFPWPVPNGANALAELRERFLAELPTHLSDLRTLHRTLVKDETDPLRFRSVQDLHKRMHSLAASAAMAELCSLALVAEAFDALLLECGKPKNLNQSTLRTIAATIDFFGFVIQKGKLFTDFTPPQATVLVVDDEPISRRAVRLALDKAQLRSICVADPLAALQIAGENLFDLIVLDVNMPTMSGFEVCTALRGLPGCSQTPVVFVTGLNDLGSRAKSTVSGGTDFIAKPFLYPELALKVLCHVLRTRK